MNVPETFFTVREELWLFGLSCLSGAVMGLCYDVLRALRQAVPHPGWAVAAEDIIFVTGAPPAPLPEARSGDISPSAACWDSGCTCSPWAALSAACSAGDFVRWDGFCDGSPPLRCRLMYFYVKK